MIWFHTLALRYLRPLYGFKPVIMAKRHRRNLQLPASLWFLRRQHIVAVTDAKGCEKTDIKRRGARQRRCCVIWSLRRTRRWRHRHSWRRGPVMVVGYVIGGSMTLLVGKSRIESAETIEAVSCIATASPLLFDVLLQPSGMGSSGIDLFRFGFRLSYGRWRNHCYDSNSRLHYGKPWFGMQA